MPININGKNGGSLNYKSLRKIESKNGIIDEISYIVLKDQFNFLNILKKSKNINVYLIANMLWLEDIELDFYYSVEDLSSLMVEKIEKERTITFSFVDEEGVDLEHEINYNNIVIL